MPKYHASVKRHGDSVPQRVMLDAEHIGKAIELMCAACSVKSTGDLAEFEILEVVGEDNYRIAARKIASQYKPPVTVTIPPVVVTKEESYDERSYQPYRVRTV